MTGREKLQETAAAHGVASSADSEQALAPRDERFGALEEKPTGGVTSSVEIDMPVMVT
jgi:hypothetical protein